MTEQRRRRFMVFMPVCVCFAGVLFLSVFWLHEYRQSAFCHISKFCEIMIENSPKEEASVRFAVKEYYRLPEREIAGNTFLAQYGYRSDEFCRKLGWDFFIAAAALFLIMASCFLISITYADRKKQIRIRELTNYLERVNAGAKGTVVFGKEDEFSHLQDEMYKTVTELYQTRESAVKAKINFADNLANIAHQLKTPITAAVLSLQLMEKTKPDIHAEQIKKQLERLSTLEESLLTLSKIDAGVLPFERKKVDIYTALNLAAESLGDLLAKEDISVDIQNCGCIEIIGDLEWTMEAFINLIKNCMEHSLQGGTIHCSYSRNPLYVEILIWDEGEGFCPEDLPHLFERFYRGKRAVGNGIGIGLPLAKSIFELQNGNITARNLPDGSACFEIRVYSH